MARKVRKFAGRFVPPALSVTGHAGSTGGHIITAGADAGGQCLELLAGCNREAIVRL